MVVLLSGVAVADGPTAVDLGELEGDGSEATPYVITNASELQAIQQDLAANYILGNDIDASETATWNNGEGFEPIGTLGSRYSGTFDGSGYVISQLVIDREGSYNIGLFGVVGSDGVIENVGVENIENTGDGTVGALVGYNSGEVLGSYTTGTITSDGPAVGGLVGENKEGTIEASYSTATIIGGTSVGGLVGNNEGTVKTSYATGDVESENYVAGGLVGHNNGGTVKQSYAVSDVDGQGNVGGLIGRNSDGIVTSSYASGGVTSEYSPRGGLIGINTDGTISDLYWDTEQSGRDVGIGNEDDTGVTGLTTSQMQGEAAEDNMSGLDFESTWRTVTNPDDYPVPKWQPAMITVSGTITDRLDAATLSGATVSAIVEPRVATLRQYDDTDVTAGDGTYELTISEHSYTVSATATVDEGFTITNTSTIAASDGKTADLALSPVYTGAGTSADPFRVETLEDLQQMRYNLSAHYELQNNISAAPTEHWFDEGTGPQGFEPIGDNTNQFTGTFDGNSNVILALTINRTGTNYVGLFGYVDGGEISSVGVIDVHVTGQNRVGGLVGDIRRGDVTESYVTGNITGKDRVGGIAGEKRGDIETSYSVGSVSGETNVGGLVGSDWSGNIRVSYTTGSVDGTSHVGGLVGTKNLNTVTDSHMEGSVNGTENIGGLIGHNSGTGVLGNSYSNGSINGTTAVGGLVGFNVGTVQGSYVTANSIVSGTTDIGGLVGSNRNTVQRSYMSGTVYGNDAVGGLIGQNQQNVLSSYATGTVDATGTSVGGLVGYDNSGDVENAYWDIGAVNQTVAVGTNETDSELTNLIGFGELGTDTPAAEMQGSSAVDSMDGLNFDFFWTAVDGYPLLSWSINTLDLTLTDDALTASQTTNATVTLTVADGETVTATTTADYTSSDSSVATASAGTVTTQGAGTAILTAEVDDIHDSAPLSVSALPVPASSGGGGRSLPQSLELRATGDLTVEATGGRAGDVVRITDETTGTPDSFGSRGNISVDSLSVELATDRDFWVTVETIERRTAGSTTNAETHDSGQSAIATEFETATGTVSVGYLTITHNLEPEDIASVTFEFSASQSLLDELDVDPTAVSLSRQASGWTSLPTNHVETTTDRSMFESTSPGFSSFAIGTNAPLVTVTNGTLDKSEIEEGDTATVTVTIENRGESRTEHTVVMTANGEERTSKTVSLGPRETAETTLSIAPSAGVYELAVDGESVGSLTVTDGEDMLVWLLLIGFISGLLALILWRRKDDTVAVQETQQT